MISPLAYIHPGAKIGEGVTIHPFAYIDDNVEIGDNCTIMPYASVLNGTRMGRNNIVYQSAIVGATPQDFKFNGDQTELVIGDNNTIREKVIINRATYAGDRTVIGNGNFLLEGVHVAHDNRIGNDCILGNGSRLAGCCVIDDKAILGSGVIIKHGCHVGGWTLVRDGCRANKDVPPYIIAAHNPITYYGINAVLLNKMGKVSEEVVDDIAKSYRQIYQSGTSVENALRRIRDLIPIGPEVQYILDFIEHSERGIIGTTM